MTRPLSFFRRPGFVVVLLSLGAVRPILSPSKTPLADDFAYHLHRLIALRHLVSEGTIFTRWFPDLALGYGYPLFNFAAPFPYYVALPFSWIVSAETAIQLTLALTVTLSGWGVFQLLRCYVQPTAALVGTSAWLYAPYLLYDVHFRANLGEVVAITFIPIALWGITNVARTPQPRWLILTACAIAATLLSHNIIGLLLIPLLLAYALILALGGRYRLLFAVILLGMAVATFFWLPAFVEKESAAFPRLMSNPAYSVFNNFLALRELLAWPPLIYVNRVNPSPPITLGVIPLGIGLLGWLGWLKMTTRTRLLYALLTVGTLLIAFMVTGNSELVWQQITLLQFFQFPWRLLAYGALFVALLVGFSAEILPQPIQLLITLLLILNGQSWTLPAYAPKGSATLADITAYEQAVGTVGTTVAGEYLPNSVDLLPDAPATTLFIGEGIVDQHRGDGIRPNFSATTTHSTPQTMTLNQFAFAGWRVSVNDLVVPITPSVPNGLITFPVPAGTSHITIQFGPTPLRTLSAFTSWVALSVLLLLAIRTKPIRAEQNRTQLAPIWIVPIAFFGLIAPLLRPTESVENSLADYGDVRLISAEIPAASAADQPILVQLIYATDATPAQILQSKLTLHDQMGVLFSLPDSRVAPRFRSAIPSNAWPPGHTAADVQLIDPVVGIPAGDYTVTLTLFDRQSGQPLRNTADNRTTFSLGTITVTPPHEPATLTPSKRVWSNQRSPVLLGYDVDRTELRPGDPLLFSLFWKAEDAVTFSPELLFLEEDTDTFNPIGAPMPQLTYAVAANAAIQTRHLLRVPAELKHDGAAIIVRLDGVDQAFISFAVDAPMRSNTPPPVDRLLRQAVGNVAILYGVTVVESEGEVSAELIWQPLRQLDTRYRVFVHLIDANGHIIAQSDADPANWTRPTTGWLPNEYISDIHRLPAPDQPYRLRIGLYDPETLMRPAEPLLLDLAE